MPQNIQRKGRQNWAPNEHMIGMARRVGQQSTSARPGFTSAGAEGCWATCTRGIERARLTDRGLRRGSVRTRCAQASLRILAVVVFG